jgi:hypothetical protein
MRDGYVRIPTISIAVREYYQSSSNGKPSTYLGARLKNIREFENDDTENGIVFPHTLVTDGDGDDCVAPVTHEFLGSCFEDGFACDYFCARFVDLV